MTASVKLSTKETIDSISSIKGAYELWDDMLKRDDKLGDCVLKTIPNNVYNIRMLGPFMPVKSYFIPVYLPLDLDFIALRNGDVSVLKQTILSFRSVIADSEILNTAQKDIALSVFDKYNKIVSDNGYMSKIYYDCADIIKIFPSYKQNNNRNNARPFNNNAGPLSINPNDRLDSNKILSVNEHHPAGLALSMLYQVVNNFFCNKGGQKMIATNIINYLDNSIMVATFPKRMMEGLMCALAGSKNKNVSGLYAHDITFSKTGQALSTKYSVKISKEPTFLPDNIVSKIVKNGLYDIPVLLESLKKNKIGRYIVEAEKKDYKMPTELYDYMLKEIKNLEEEKHLDAVESDIASLPKEAFENSPNSNNVVQWIKI